VLEIAILIDASMLNLTSMSQLCDKRYKYA